jgi:hypothetical protein
VNLNVLALVALFTGGLLVFSTQTHAVVRRRAQLALLRVLGVTRRRLTLMIVAEGAVVGVVGSVMGLAGGFALAQLAVRSYGADLGSGFFRGVTPSLALEPRRTRCLLRAWRAGCGRGGAPCRQSRPRGRHPRERSRPVTRRRCTQDCVRSYPGSR